MSTTVTEPGAPTAPEPTTTPEPTPTPTPGPEPSPEPTPPPGAPESFTREYVEALRREAAGHRDKARTIEDELKTVKDSLAELQKAQLSDEEKKDVELKELREKETALTSEVTIAQNQVRDLDTELAVVREATKTEYGIVDADAAVRLLDLSQITRDADGKPTNIAELLKGLVEARPFLKGQAVSTQQVAPPVDPTNPQKPQSGSQYTREKLRSMSPDEINADWDNIQKQLKAGTVT